VSVGTPHASDPRDFFRLLWRRKWTLIPCLVLIPLAVYLVSTRLTKTYEASAVIQLQGAPVDQTLPGVGDLTAGSNDQQTNDRVSALIETNSVADGASRLLGEPPGTLRGDVRASADENTGFITITAKASTAKRAARIANTFADATRVTRARQGTQRVDAAIAGVQAQLAKTPQADAAARQQLSEQLQGLTALRAAQGQNTQVIQAATPPASPSSPKPGKNAIFAFAVALLLGAGLVALVDRLDRRVHDPDELEKLTGAPLLVHLPPTVLPGSAPDPGVAVVFQMLRDSLTYFNVDSPLETLAVVSSLKGEGKTTVVANLALSYARAGKRVVAIDADLRDPDLGPRLGLDGTPGLSTVLAGEIDLDVAVREVEEFGGNLRVLPAGPPPPNPSELLNSRRMSWIVDRLKESSDLVIIDTPPLLVVSDAFGVVERASGAVGVVRLERTANDAAARLARVVGTLNTRLLGTVAIGGASLSGYGYGYGYGYGDGETPSSGATTSEADVSINGSGPASAVAEEQARGRSS
jgi:receptor protein-tyrosine kinase